MDKLKQWARQLKADLYMLYCAGKNKATPWYAKALIVLVLAYALSPIDLIPDFIPILGFLDDLILLPVGIYIAVRLIPEEILIMCREQERVPWDKKKSWIGAGLVLFIWAIVIYFLVRKFS